METPAAPAEHLRGNSHSAAHGAIVWTSPPNGQRKSSTGQCVAQNGLPLTDLHAGQEVASPTGMFD